MTLISETNQLITHKSPLEPIKNLLMGDFYNYWFMFMLFGLYLLAPIIIRIKESISNKSFCTASIIWIILSVVSQTTSTYRVSYAFGIIFSYVGYFLIGNVIYENFSNKNKSALFFFLGAVMFAITFFYRFFTGSKTFAFNQYSSFFSPTVVLASIFIFIAFSNINIKANLKKLSDKTFYIYLLHTAIYKIIFMIIGKLIIINEPIMIIIVTLTTFVLSWVFATIYIKLWNICENKFNWKIKWNKTFLIKNS